MIEFIKSNYEAPFGRLYLLCDTSGVVYALMFSDKISQYIERNYKSGDYLIKCGELSAKVKTALDNYFAGNANAFDNIETKGLGTKFQKAAWNALKQIPYGQTASYGEQAQNIGNPKAVRAIGGANSKNPISIIVPCHRVIGKDGSLTGFGGGLEVKQWLLHHEGIIAS